MALTPLDFPASPTVGTLYPDPPVTGQPTYRWDGAQWLSYAAASLPTPTKPANYGKKNYIINGAMQISQENGTAAGTTHAYYPVDMFAMNKSNAGTQTVQQVLNRTPSGSVGRIRVTATVADASVASGDYLALVHITEGLRTVDLAFGSAIAKTVTIQFGVCAPAGTYCVVLGNYDANRSYVAEYVISAGEANTDVVKSLTYPGDITGAWGSGNVGGFYIRWGLMAGTTFQQAAGSWGTVTNPMGSSNQFNFMGTAGNVFELFDVSLTEGSVAPPFQVPDYASELALCQRYYSRRAYPNLSRFVALKVPGEGLKDVYSFPVQMRAAPTLAHTLGAGWAYINAAGTGIGFVSVPTAVALSDREGVFNGPTADADSVPRIYYQQSGATQYINANARL